MSSHIAEVLADLGEEVATLRLAPPAAVRRRGDVRRRNTALGVAGAVGVVAMGTAVTGAVPLPSGQHASPGVGSSGPTASACRMSPPAMVEVKTDHLMVWLKADATPLEVAAIETALKSRPAVVTYSFVDAPSAYQRFTILYACRQGWAAPTEPSALGRSIVITLRSPADLK